MDALLTALLAQVECVCIVDNGPAGEAPVLLTQAVEAFSGRVRLIRNAANIGLAAAQNQGIRHALEEGFDWVLLLDDDSLPEAHMVQHMLAAWQPVRNTHIGILAPRIVEQNITAPGRYPVPWGRLGVRRKTVKPGEQLLGAITVIASGSLIHREVFDAIGLMAEGFFIDYVDHEFCLRARTHGYEIMVVGDAALLHRQGNKSRHRLLGVHVVTPNYPPLRRYYIFRNRMFVLRRYGLRFPFLWPYEGMAYLWDAVRILLIETGAFPKLASAARGFLEGMTRRVP